MTMLKSPAEISAELFNKAMKEFEKSWNGHPINDEQEQAYLKVMADRQTHLEDAFTRINFDLQKGTLIKIDLGPEGSEARSKWQLSAYRPEGLYEGDILLYSGWFQRKVNVFGDATIPGTSDSYVEGKDKDEELTEAFSTKIQLFVKAGKEEVWAGLIPDFYYVTLIEGSGGVCTEPLFVQEQGLALKKDLIASIIKTSKNQNLTSDQPPIPKLTDTTQKTMLRKVVKDSYDKNYHKAEEEARKHQSKVRNSELHKLADALGNKPVSLKK